MASIKDTEHLRIPFQDIEIATKNFTTLIGEGGFGKVYRGELFLGSKLTIVAVKRLNASSMQGSKQFLNEVHLLSRYKHPNLVSLLGFCEEDKEKILVYEHAEHGSFDQFICKDTSLTCMQKINICIDAALGLDYLHNHVAEKYRIIHRDIKSSNILLDHRWRGMISDLGLSKIGCANEKDTFLVTDGCGTFGYCEPEYIQTGVLTKECDIYSFGVVLFEVLCGKWCFIEVDDKRGYLAHYARQYYMEDKLHEIIDPIMKEQLHPSSLKKISYIAYQCLRSDRKKRPSMSLVVRKLKQALNEQEKYIYNGDEYNQPISMCASLPGPSDIGENVVKNVKEKSPKVVTIEKERVYVEPPRNSFSSSSWYTAMSELDYSERVQTDVSSSCQSGISESSSSPLLHSREPSLTIKSPDIRDAVKESMTREPHVVSIKPVAKAERVATAMKHIDSHWPFPSQKFSIIDGLQNKSAKSIHDEANNIADAEVNNSSQDWLDGYRRPIKGLLLDIERLIFNDLISEVVNFQVKSLQEWSVRPHCRRLFQEKSPKVVTKGKERVPVELPRNPFSSTATSSLDYRKRVQTDVFKNIKESSKLPSSVVARLMGLETTTVDESKTLKTLMGLDKESALYSRKQVKLKHDFSSVSPKVQKPQRGIKVSNIITETPLETAIRKREAGGRGPHKALFK